MRKGGPRRRHSLRGLRQGRPRTGNGEGAGPRLRQGHGHQGAFLHGKGEKTFTCRRDKAHVKTEEIAAKGHSFGKWKTLRQPDEEQEGLQERVCKVCGAKESRALAKRNPGETVVPKTADTNRYGLPYGLMSAALAGLLLDLLLKRRLAA